VIIMQVRLSVRWGSYLQGDVVSVSEARAKALTDAGFGKILDAPKEPEAVPAESKRTGKK